MCIVEDSKMSLNVYCLVCNKLLSVEETEVVKCNGLKTLIYCSEEREVEVEIIEVDDDTDLEMSRWLS